MQKTRFALLTLLMLILPFGMAHADKYTDTITVFKNAGESGGFFNDAYGYAVFPTIGKAGFVVGGAGGEGRVIKNGERVGKTTMAQLSVGFQAGGQAYSMIIFFEDERAFNEFTSGSFEFSAQAEAVAITAGAQATASTKGNSAGASGGRNDATTAGGYNKGMATFIVAKGGLMAGAAIGGASFTYEAL